MTAFRSHTTTWTRWYAEVQRLLLADGLDRDFFGFDYLQDLYAARTTPDGVLAKAKELIARGFSAQGAHHDTTR